MLPVGVTLIRLAREQEERELTGLSALLLLSIAYGCALAALGTPSGGARNAIMIDYWRRLAGTEVTYLGWVCTRIRSSCSRCRRGVDLSAQLPPRVQDSSARSSASGASCGRRWLGDGGLAHGGGVRAHARGVDDALRRARARHHRDGRGQSHLVIGVVKWEDYNVGVNGRDSPHAAAISLGGRCRDGRRPWLGTQMLGALPPPVAALPPLVIGTVALVTFSSPRS